MIGFLRILFSWLAIGLGGGVLVWIIWMVLGRAIATSLDRHFLNASSDAPASPVLIGADDFIIGSRRWPLPRTGRFNLKVTLDGQNRVLFSAGDGTITLGPVSKIWAEPKGPEYLFSPEAADTVSFARSTSRFAWPTSPFRYKIMGGASPSWRRYAYDCLIWTKISGATLEVVWRDEQCFYSGHGWVDTNTNQLTRITLRRSPFENTVTGYLSRAKGWSQSDYRLEWSALDRNSLKVTVVALTDELAQTPGAGKSIELLLDRSSGTVSKERAFQ